MIPIPNIFFRKLNQQLGGVMKLLFILLLGLGFSQTELTMRVYEVDDFLIGIALQDLGIWN